MIFKRYPCLACGYRHFRFDPSCFYNPSVHLNVSAHLFIHLKCHKSSAVGEELGTESWEWTAVLGAAASCSSALELWIRNVKQNKQAEHEIYFTWSRAISCIFPLYEYVNNVYYSLFHNSIIVPFVIGNIYFIAWQFTGMGNLQIFYFQLSWLKNLLYTKEMFFFLMHKIYSLMVH